ncbi:hypothetical protein [Candidatus Puniceispirillum marinum]|uniref:Uncharacterized protein n=1 Tax=Puniceispirillum marinum (strain IMCC1322) TaxID=488538 RepID=D5BU37_PUNMI|nr:hypothetical protein [Candidatus Puniceispirillum marinum]ADE39784.1 hypothetical protein SAR116_1541 [Candidatus Puniceispirillum marinum IMCC1322]
MDDENAVLGVCIFKMLIDNIARYTKAARNQADIATIAVSMPMKC